MIYIKIFVILVLLIILYSVDKSYEHFNTGSFLKKDRTFADKQYNFRPRKGMINNGGKYEEKCVNNSPLKHGMCINNASVLEQKADLYSINTQNYKIAYNKNPDYYTDLQKVYSNKYMTLEDAVLECNGNDNCKGLSFIEQSPNTPYRGNNVIFYESSNNKYYDPNIKEIRSENMNNILLFKQKYNGAINIKNITNYLVKYIKLYRNDGSNQYVHVSEINLYNTKGQKVVSSLIFPTLYPTFEGTNSAINLINDSDIPAHTLIHAEAFMQLELINEKKISKIELKNRSDCCQDRLIGCSVILISLNDEILQTIPITVSQQSYTFNITRNNIPVKYVRVARTDNKYEILNIDKLFLYDENGTIIPANNIIPTLYPEFNYERNSNKEYVPRKHYYPAFRVTDDDDKTFAHTGNAVNAFIQLELKTPTELSRVEIVNRLDDCCRHRLNGTVLDVYGKGKILLYRFPINEIKDRYVFELEK
jgi:hypothetical protein